MIPGVIAASVVAMVITSLVQWRHRGGRPPGALPRRQRSAQQHSPQQRSPQQRAAQQWAVAGRRRLRPDEERMLAELDATWEPGYADRVTALLRPDADVDLPPA